jgi:hypothetical protein
VVEDLSGTVRRLSAENAILRGQLAGRVGVPTPWPPDLPALYRADGFEARSRALLAEVPGAELVRWDCDEYPCVAYYRLGDSSRPIADALREPLEATYGDDAGILLFGVQDTDNDQRPVSLAAVAVIPEERGPTFDAVRSRSITRVQDALDDIASEP